MQRIYVVGTADTKGEELAYLRDRVWALGGNAVVVDVGIRDPAIEPDVSAGEVASHEPDTAEALLLLTDRGAAVARMGGAFARFIATRKDIGAIVGIGGGGGTSIITAGMRRLPIGLPKLMVSTLASGDVAPFVGVSDIVMMPSITDLAGLNRISRVILDNAAHAIVGMSGAETKTETGRPAVGLTMFGVTTPCVTEIARLLGNECEPVIFHATGTGGRSMEALVDSALLTSVIDITTTEVCDLLFGGVLPATEDRFGAIARTKVPYVVSVGALDMINFWAPETIPARLGDRQIYKHNPNVTLMRTTADECRQIGAWIGDKLNLCDGLVRVLIPEKGVSALDIVGGAFFDPVADAALFDALERTVRWSDHRRLTRLPLHINDPDFAAAAVSAWREITL